MPRRPTTRRAVLAAALGTSGLLAAPLATPGRASDAAARWPSRPVRLIVASAAGGNADLVARLLAAELEAAHGGRVVVENMPAVSGVRAVEAAARAEPDGHTLLVGTSSQLVMNLALFDPLPVDLEREVRGVAMLNRVPMALAVPASEPARDLAAFRARLAASGAEAAYGSGPTGTTTHIAGALFVARSGVRALHVPYTSSALAATDLVAGRLAFMFDALVTALPHAREGRTRLLALASARRSPAAPDLPTMAEAGLPGFEAATWNSVAAPAALPDALAREINAAVGAALARPALAERLAALGAEPLGDPPPEEVDAFYRAERALWLPVLRDAGVRPAVVN